ncbi:hypothetical protein SEA_FAUST_205 [Streptomyces phage Faust]|uniref:Uncharacterized protein n=1 Tax=Streptomyces phage Faust TaxID=2767565 RepID=A0A7G9UZ22_9CAUD|nr:hypothetical protein PP456_gp082 [Streptomyces phage Faust]QNN99277.1 hypothetical protein SEA_FAUST_205 [Streptomyces phage Faust]
MNTFAVEFERYVTNKWMLEGKHYNLHGMYSFYESLWDGEVSELRTPYGTVKRIHSSTDYEDGLEQRIMIIQVGDRHFRKVGYYNSWDSSNWDGDLVEVRPREKTVTVYETV